MQRGTKEFYEIQKQFEMDLKAMPVFISANDPFLKDNYNKSTFYANGQINTLFIGYMTGYANARAMAIQGYFDDIINKNNEQ